MSWEHCSHFSGKPKSCELAQWGSVIFVTQKSRKRKKQKLAFTSLCDKQEDHSAEVTCERLTQPVPCCCSEASLGTEFSTQTPPAPYTQYLASPVQLHVSSFLSTMAPPRSLAHRVYKDGCRVVLSALGEFTFKKGQHGGGGRTPEKIITVHPQLGVGGLEDGGSFASHFFPFYKK